MKSPRFFILHFLLPILPYVFGLPSLAISQDEIKQPHVRAQLLSEHTSVTPGISELFALRLIPDPSWHLYWKYPGDSGAAPILTWLIDGHSIDAPLSWPTPEKIEVGSFVNYGYQGEVLLFAELPIPKEAKDTITVGLDAEWLVCQEECIPGNGIFSLTLPVGNGDGLVRSQSASLFEQFLRRIPTDGADLSLTLSETTPNTFTLTIPTLPPSVESLTFIPGAPGIIQNNAPQIFSMEGASAQLTLHRANNQNSPSTFHGILVSRPPFKDGSTGKKIQIPLPSLDMSSTGSDSAPQESLWLILLSALLGGLILNLMPCVFPVLAIKVLSFVNKAGKDSRFVRGHGLSFGFGVLTSFWILATLIRGLREAGESLGWGFQLQNPSFVAILILLMLAVALNLFGVFEFGTSLQRISGRVDGTKQEGYLS
ncbi:MAG: protein-disulfide reductase DsbD domain-containing protein [Bdellovibrionota bacterium]